MADSSVLWFLAFAWLVLSAGCEDSSPKKPYSQHLRFRHGAMESSTWLASVATLSSIFAMGLLAMYALHCACAKKILSGCPAEEEWHKQREARSFRRLPSPSSKVKKGSQGSCRETKKNRVAAYASSSKEPQCDCYLSGYTQSQWAYAQRLAFMSQELEGFMREIQTQQCALGDNSLTEQCQRCKSHEETKLNITVYEVALVALQGLRRSQRK